MEVGHSDKKGIRKSSQTRLASIDCVPACRCVFFVCTCPLLNVVSHYGVSVLSMSVMGFQKKNVYKWVGRWIEFFLICSTFQSPYLGNHQTTPHVCLWNYVVLST